MRLNKLRKNLDRNGPSAEAVRLIEDNLSDVQNAVRIHYVPKLVTYSGLAFAKYAFATYVRKAGFAGVVKPDSKHLWKLKDADWSRGFELEDIADSDPDLVDRELRALLGAKLYAKYAKGELTMKEFVKERPAFFAVILDFALDA